MFPTTLVLSLILALIVITLIATLASRYRRCPSNRILVIYGKTGRGAARTIHGGAAFVWPVLQDYAYLDLEPFVVPIELTNALSQENIRVSVPTTVTAAISTDPGLMQNAAIRLLGLTADEIREQAQDIILGQMRAVIATMPIEDINRDRQAFMAKVNEAVSTELEKIGITVINVNIRDIQDESGYIVALGKKAAAEAINQAMIDVAEQEKIGKMGVAERQRDQRKSVAAADAAAVIGEKQADRDRRQSVARFDMQAVQVETENEAQKATYEAQMHVVQEQSRQKAQEAAKMADGAIRVADENAQRDAEEARAKREASRLKAEVVVPAEAQRESVVIAADAERQRSIRVAEGASQAVLLRMKAEAEGMQAVLDGKAKGYEELVTAAHGASRAAALLVIEKLVDVAQVQAQAIQNLPLDKVVVWDSGGSGDGGLSNLGKRLVGVLPPMHELAKLAGLELPDFLGTMAETDEPQPEGPATPEPAQAEAPAQPQETQPPAAQKPAAQAAGAQKPMAPKPAAQTSGSQPKPKA